MSVRQEYICVGCGTAHIEITDSIEPRIDTCPDCRGETTGGGVMFCDKCGAKANLYKGPYKDFVSKKLVEIEYLMCPACGETWFCPDAIDKLEATRDGWHDKYYGKREDILDECAKRMRQGEVEYADRDVTASRENLMKRDLKREMIEELYDLINYAVARIIQIEEQD